MPDVVLQITVPDAKVEDATLWYLTLYPNKELVDPEDPESGLKYTTKQWVEEKLMRTLLRDIHRGRMMLAQAAATVPLDNTMATRS